MNTEVTRDLILDLFSPKCVLNEILYFQNVVSENIERINNPETNPKIKRLLKYENSRHKKSIANDKRRLNLLLSSKCPKSI
jgi:hypothetical protein